jgi:DNA polymerase-4
MARYRAVSRQLFAQLRQEFDRLEPLGLGAAYFDLTGVPAAPEEIARRMQSGVERLLHLPLRVGIGTGRMVARLAAEEAGPGGMRRILPGSEPRFLSELPATRIEGVGTKTAATLAELGAHTIGEVADLGGERLEEALGTHGLRILAFAEGRDERPVRGTQHPLSISREATVKEGSLDLQAIGERLQSLAQRIADELELQGLYGVRVALKLRFSDQTTATRSLTLGEPTSAAAEIHRAALVLLERAEAGGRVVRSLGLQLAGLQRQAAGGPQLELFPSSL